MTPSRDCAAGSTAHCSFLLSLEPGQTHDLPFARCQEYPWQGALFAAALVQAQQYAVACCHSKALALSTLTPTTRVLWQAAEGRRDKRAQALAAGLAGPSWCALPF